MIKVFNFIIIFVLLACKHQCLKKFKFSKKLKNRSKEDPPAAAPAEVPKTQAELEKDAFTGLVSGF